MSDSDNRRRFRVNWNHPRQAWDYLHNRLASVFQDTWKQATESHLQMVAASLAFTTILSIVPLIAVSFAFFRAVGGLDSLYSSLEPLIIGALAEGSGQMVMGKIREFVGNIHAGAVGASGFAMLIFTSMSLLNSAEKAINHIWRTQSARSLFNRIMSYWFIVSLGPLALSFLVAASSSKDLRFTKLLPTGSLGFFLVVILFYGVYKYVPHRKVNILPALSGAILTATLWSLAKFAFTLFASQAVNYNKIYGSLGAIPIFMLWIYLLWSIVLTGTAFSAAIQKRFELH